MDNLFEQMTAISKGSAYDAIRPEYERLQQENALLKDRVKYLEGLINEYTLKMKANLSGGKVDDFLSSQLGETDKEIEEELSRGKNQDDLNAVL
ncbi:MAG TPA: hypothetical protein PKV73_00945 [Agriterribacter sp.]|nr:hypothetical protein [Agriterribacter sp.]